MSSAGDVKQIIYLYCKGLTNELELLHWPVIERVNKNLFINNQYLYRIQNRIRFL